MDPKTDIKFLSKPKIDPNEFDYIKNTKDVYANLFEINLKKEIKMYQYPYSVAPEIPSGETRIRQYLFKACSKELKSIYGECFISGDSLYGIKEEENIRKVKSTLNLKGKETDYILTFQKVTKEKIIKKEDIHKDPLAKQFIELLIKDILHSNPKLEFYKGLFVLTTKKKYIETDRVSISFYPGFATSFMETDGGNYLNVTLKNKIIQNDSILDILNNLKYTNKANQEDIKDKLINRSFKVSYAKKNYIIKDIIFDSNPKNKEFLYEGETINLVRYYEIAHGLKIKNVTQPLILVTKNGPQNEIKYLYFVPEFCYLAGLEDESVKDGYFMKELAKYTKLEPSDRVNKINAFLDLLNDPAKDKDNPKKLSAKEKSELYGIEVKPLNQLFTAYYMEETKLLAKNKSISSGDRTFPVYKKVDM